MSTSKAQSPWRGTRRKRDSEYPGKREAVLQAAASLFRERGYDGTSLNELADILNITKPTVYYYVKSKDDLILQIKWQAQEEVLAFMHKAEDAGGKAYDILRSIMIDYAVYMTTDFGVCLALVPPRSMEPKSRELIYGRVREANQVLDRVLALGHKDGSLSVADPAVAIRTLFGALNWIGSWYKPSRKVTARALAEMQVDMLLNGVRGPSAPKRTAAKGSASAPVAPAAGARKRSARQ